MEITNTVLESLTTNQEYTTKVLPHLKEEYFEEPYQKNTFNVIKSYVEKHHALPDQDTILIDVEKVKGLTDSEYQDIVELTKSWKDKPTNKSLTWLVENTEEWCKNRAFYLALREATKNLDDSKSKDRGDLPELMRDALAVCFDTKIGHDFFEDWEKRWHHYTDPDERIPFDLDLLNKMTAGGVKKKTLNCIMGGVHSGKTRMLCHFAASYVNDGLNVLYITMEMAEEEIAQRIDANILGIEMEKLKSINKDIYQRAVENHKKKTKGNVIVKEFPTGSAHSGHFRHVIKELRQKKDFQIDVLIVDYINICASSRANKGQGSYTFVQTIAEELRGLGQEFNVPVWTGTQVNRDAFKSSDPDMDDVAESWGLPATCDFLGVIITDENLQTIQQVIFKQLKSRYDDKNKLPKGILNYDNSIMRMTDAPRTSGLQPPTPPNPTNSNYSGFKV